MIGKIDITANEILGMHISGIKFYLFDYFLKKYIKDYPTIKLYLGNNKSKPLNYDGEKTEEEILNWLKKHTSYFSKILFSII